MTDRTPTPWYSSPAIGIEDQVLYFDFRQDKGKEFTHALASTCAADTLEHQKANAAFIVRAVNSHEALVALAKEVAAQWEGTDAPIGKQAVAALKLVEASA